MSNIADGLFRWTRRLLLAGAGLFASLRALRAPGVVRATMAGFRRTLSGVRRLRAIKLREPSGRMVEARASGMFFLIRQETLRMAILATSPVIIIIGGARILICSRAGISPHIASRPHGHAFCPPALSSSAAWISMSAWSMTNRQGPEPVALSLSLGPTTGIAGEGRLAKRRHLRKICRLRTHCVPASRRPRQTLADVQ